MENSFPSQHTCAAGGAHLNGPTFKETKPALNAKPVFVFNANGPGNNQFGPERAEASSFTDSSLNRNNVKSWRRMARQAPEANNNSSSILQDKKRTGVDLNAIFFKRVKIDPDTISVSNAKLVEAVDRPHREP